jgi:hypothetical protein
MLGTEAATMNAAKASQDGVLRTGSESALVAALKAGVLASQVATAEALAMELSTATVVLASEQGTVSSLSANLSARNAALSEQQVLRCGYGNWHRH